MTAALRRTLVRVDERARRGARLRTHRQRELAATLSDVLLAGTMIDAALLAGWTLPRAPRVHGARRASATHLLALGITLGLGHLVKDTVGRARPFERERGDDAACRSPAGSASFYSLHSAMAFASAGFSCAMHVSRAMTGARDVDALPSLASLVTAGATGMLRVLSDRHYLSDVIAGAGMGLVVGALFPFAIVPVRAPAVSRRATGRW
jgi:membrane-associated phospholipid phosphatase